MYTGKLNFLFIIVLIPMLTVSVSAGGNADKLDFRLSRILWEYENPELIKIHKLSFEKSLLRVSIRFKTRPSPGTIRDLESLGIQFDYLNDKILHIGRIYEAFIPIDRLESLSGHQEILNIIK